MQERDQEGGSMTPEEKIEELRNLLFRESAMNLLNFQRHADGETRSWDDLTEEEQKARMEFAETYLKIENPRVFADD
jgi:hypothetical protein